MASKKDTFGIASTIKTPLIRQTQTNRHAVRNQFAVPKRRHELFFDVWEKRDNELELTKLVAKNNVKKLHNSLIQIGRTLLEGEDGTTLDATENDLIEFNESLEKAFVKVNSILQENIFLREINKKGRIGSKVQVNKYFVRQRRLTEPENLKLREWHSKEFRLRGAMALLQRK